jgi:hypothetical protein
MRFGEVKKGENSERVQCRLIGPQTLSKNSLDGEYAISRDYRHLNLVCVKISKGSHDILNHPKSGHLRRPTARL